jgi:4-diphosphocytidyl-2-C-methyl-D-erythritol kinase
MGAAATSGEAAAFAAAKLNLYLHVVGRRADGYHLLDSLVAFADVGDTVRVRPARGLALSVEGPMAGGLAGDAPGDNLVARAARLLAEAVGRAPDAAVTLTKRLPVASGIGGGSADAAATLRALARLWGLAPDDPRLGEVAPRLGADVPVCLGGRAARMGGIGERVEPVAALPEAGVLLVNPGFPLSTPAVFKARTGPFSAPAGEGIFRDPPRDAAGLSRALAACRNDLAPPALALAPAIAEVLAAIGAEPGCLLARLSGSGATCFGLFADRAGAEAAAARISDRDRPGWWVRAGRLVSDGVALDGGLPRAG